jgi:Family of unknown function (DUF5362)
MDNNQNLLSNDLIIDSIGGMHLKETAMWAKIISIAGFIMSSLIFMMAIFAGSILAKMGTGRYGSVANTTGVAVTVGVFYGLVAVVFFICSLFQFRFASKLKTALNNNDQATLNYSLQNLKAYYRITGVLTIIGSAILILGVFGMLAAQSYSRY